MDAKQKKVYWKHTIEIGNKIVHWKQCYAIGNKNVASKQPLDIENIVHRLETYLEGLNFDICF